MKSFNSILQRVRGSSKKAVLGVAMALTLASAGIVGANSINGKAYASGGDCSGNSIVQCGAGSRQDLINKIKGNKQLQAVYAQFGLQSSDYNRFVKDAKPGVAYSNNTIVVNGNVVATNAGSIGNYKSYQGSNPRHFKIANHDYWGNVNSKAFANGTNALPVDVLFNDKGQVQFAVMTGTCGNPTYQTPVTPTYSCNELKTKKIATNDYQLQTSASAGHGAKIQKVVYSFSDGSASVTETNPSTIIKHKVYKDTRVTVTVYVEVPGGNVVKLSGANCTKSLTYEAPKVTPPTCDLLTLTPGKVDTDGSTSYSLTARATANDSTIKSFNFTFGDGKTAVVPTSMVSANSSHTYAPGSYTAKVSVTAMLKSGSTTTVTSANCAKPVTVTPPVQHPSVTITKNVDNVKSKEVAVGQNFTYQVAVTNNGDTALTNVAVTDNAPAGVTLLNADKGQIANATTWSYTIPSLKVNETVTFNLVAKVDAYVAGNLVNTACVDAPQVPNPPATSDNHGKDACDTATVTVTPPAKHPGVTITKHVDNVKAKQVAVGQEFTYELVVTNTGDVTLTNTVVTDNAPAGVTLLTADQGQISNGSTWSYTIPSLAPGQTANFNLTAKVPAQVNNSLVNTACVDAPEVPNPAANSSNNGKDACDTATVNVPPVVPTNPNISINKTVDGMKSEQVAVGQTFKYQLVITNTGQKDLVNVRVSDTAPQGVSLISTDLGTITVAGANGNDTGVDVLAYTIPSLTVGQSVTINITAKVNNYVAGNLINTACVNAAEINPENPNENDACSTATVTVTPPATPPAPTTPVTPNLPQPKVLVNTGAGSMIGLFGAATIIGIVGHRVFLSRRLTRQN